MAFSAVLVIGATAALQAVSLAGEPLSLAATAYGRVCLAKAALFAALLALAVRNQWRLRRGASAAALGGSIGTAIVLAALILALAVILSAMPPPSEA